MGHLCCVITDVPPQPNSHSASVLYDCMSPRAPEGGGGESSKCVTEDYRTGALAPQDSRHSAPPAPACSPHASHTSLWDASADRERVETRSAHMAHGSAHGRPQREWRLTPIVGFPNKGWPFRDHGIRTRQQSRSHLTACRDMHGQLTAPQTNGSDTALLRKQALEGNAAVQ